MTSLSMQPPAWHGASSALSQQILQDNIVQHGISQKPLQSCVLGFQRLQFASIRHIHAAVLCFPFVKTSRADTVKSYSLSTPADLRRRHPALLFVKDRDDLFFSESRISHVRLLVDGLSIQMRDQMRQTSGSRRRDFSGKYSKIMHAIS